MTIEDSLGIVYSDGFMIKEGEYLPGFIAPDPMKDLIRGDINRIRWFEVRPQIDEDANNRVVYGETSALGDWIDPYKFPYPPPNWGWGWQENVGDMFEGTLRYQLHIENCLGLIKLQEATTPKGIDLFRVSTKGDYTNEIVQWASSYLGVPYVHGYHNNEHNQQIVKGLHRGYEGIECSGLAGWSYVWVGEDLDNNPATSDEDDINNTNADMLETYYGKADQEPDSARDGDMWYVDWDSDVDVDHVGIFYYAPMIGPPSEKWIIHASAGNDEVENRIIEHFENGHWIRDYPWWFNNFDGLGRIPHN